MLTAVTGINWGDEGKGRGIDLCRAGRCGCPLPGRKQCRSHSGNHQGKFVLNLPSGILHPGVVCVLGDGMVVDLNIFPRKSMK